MCDVVTLGLFVTLVNAVVNLSNSSFLIHLDEAIVMTEAVES